MTPGTHASPPPPDPHRSQRRTWAWRIGTPVVLLLSGSLFVVSATSSEGTDLRPGRYTDLASVARAETERYEDLRSRVEELNADVGRLTEQVASSDVRRLRRKVERLDDPAGLSARSGPGLTVTLSDAPVDLAQQLADAGQDVNLLVVHQQDIQAVVNAMWRGGAAAVTVQGQRVVSTTGIECKGNSVTLQGVPYPQPYVISGIGDPAALAAAIDADATLQEYRRQSEDPSIQIGWDLQEEAQVEAPAYDGLLDLGYAEPLT